MFSEDQWVFLELLRKTESTRQLGVLTDKQVWVTNPISPRGHNGRTADSLLSVTFSTSSTHSDQLPFWVPPKHQIKANLTSNHINASKGDCHDYTWNWCFNSCVGCRHSSSSSRLIKQPLDSQVSPRAHELTQVDGAVDATRVDGSFSNYFAQ